MSFADFKDNTMRAVVSKTIDGVLKYVNKHDDRTEALLKLTDLSEKLMGDKFEKKVFDGARNLIHNPDAKWMKYTNKVLDEIDPACSENACPEPWISGRFLWLFQNL